MVLFTIAGFQDPAIPFVEVVDKTGADPPLQIAGRVALNTEFSFVCTTTVEVL